MRIDKIKKQFDSFRLIRQSDDLIYEFDKVTGVDGSFAYKRRDADLWIKYGGEEDGWVASDNESGEIMGRLWDIKGKDQSLSHPPEGIWVSKKGSKSYVYLLRYSP